MSNNKKDKSNKCTFWLLLLLFSIYWFVFFPIVWFVIQPAAFQASHLATILYALLFVAAFIVLYCIIYCCLRCVRKRHSDTQVQDTCAKLVSVEARPESLYAQPFLRKERPASKRVLIPTVPVAAANEGVRYTCGDANRDSTITIPLFVDDRDEDKTKFATKQELWFDGSNFHDRE